MLKTLLIIAASLSVLWLLIPLTRRVALVAFVIVRRFSPIILAKLRLIKYPTARAVRLAFEDLGPAYVKFGQMIASSPTAFAPEVAQEFEVCFDEVRPLPARKIKKLIAKEIGNKSDSAFESIEAEALASASIAQVHQGKLKDGSDIVVKIQRPGIRSRVEQDLRIMSILTFTAEKIFKNLHRANPTGIVKDLKRTMLEEMDFTKEAQNIKEFKQMLVENNLDELATAPKVYNDLSTDKVIVMDKLNGVRIDDKAGVDKRVEESRTVLRQTSKVFWTGIFLGGVFHGDIHAGNILVLDDGRLGYLDFGIFGRFTMEDREALVSWMAGMATSDGEKLAQSMKQMHAISDDVDWDMFVKDVKETFLPLRSATVDNPELIESFFPKLREMALKYDMRLPENFVLILKQVTYLGRYIMIHDPGYNEHLDPESKKNLMVLFQKFNALRAAHAETQSLPS